MNCNEASNRLDALVDRELEPAEEAAVRHHLDGCLRCRAQLLELESLLQQAAELPAELDPGHDLWPAIADRLGAQAAELIRLDTARHRRLRPFLAAAAAVLMAAIALVLLRGGDDSRLSSPPLAPDHPGATVSDEVVQAAYGGVDAELVRVRNQLRALVEARRHEIAPATMEVIDDNLRVIDAAVARIAAALASEPDNSELNRLLLAACRQELSLLVRVSQLPPSARES